MRQRIAADLIEVFESPHLPASTQDYRSEAVPSCMAQHGSPSQHKRNVPDIRLGLYSAEARRGGWWSVMGSMRSVVRSMWTFTFAWRRWTGESTFARITRTFGTVRRTTRSFVRILMIRTMATPRRTTGSPAWRCVFLTPIHCQRRLAFSDEG